MDRLQALDASLLLSSEEGHGRMFAYETDNYKVISSSVVTGALANSDSLNIKPYLLSEFVNYFIGYNPVTSLAENVARIISGKVYPNPFTGPTTITFSLTVADFVSVTIFDIHGKVVKHLSDEEYLPGEHKITWESTDDHNKRVNPGIYFCTIKTGHTMDTQKLIILP